MDEKAQGEWVVVFDDAFDVEFECFSAGVQDQILVKAGLLARFGPHLGRPHADHLKGSAFPNMKELRFKFEGQVWRVAYAFDPERNAIVLAAGDKQGQDEKRFYKELIAVADGRFAKYRLS
jgi:hypothetical protein